MQRWQGVEVTGSVWVRGSKVLHTITGRFRTYCIIYERFHSMSKFRPGGLMIMFSKITDEIQAREIGGSCLG
jgi:hypothetical protein